MGNISHQNQLLLKTLGLNGRNELAQRATFTGWNWPERPVSQDKTGPKVQCTGKTKSKVEIETQNRNFKMKLEVEIETRNRDSMSKLENKTHSFDRQE